mmetsp:Transcript_12635/g.32719  ORF Transcript_12635/g.32719 Transcript_12635/m.32719 type:complete len:308 (-) Transcript_12635:1091-2014(-)
MASPWATEPWRSLWRNMPSSSVSSLWSCCRCRSTRRTSLGATNAPRASTRWTAGSARPTTFATWWTHCTGMASLSSSTSSWRTLRATPGVWRATAARRSLSTKEPWASCRAGARLASTMRSQRCGPTCAARRSIGSRISTWTGCGSTPSLPWSTATSARRKTVTPSSRGAARSTPTACRFFASCARGFGGGIRVCCWQPKSLPISSGSPSGPPSRAATDSASRLKTWASTLSGTWVSPSTHWRILARIQRPVPSWRSSVASNWRGTWPTPSTSGGCCPSLMTMRIPAACWTKWRAPVWGMLPAGLLS